MITKQALTREVPPKADHPFDLDPATFLKQQMTSMRPELARIIEREMQVRIIKVLRDLAYQVAIKGKITISLYDHNS